MERNEDKNTEEKMDRWNRERDSRIARVIARDVEERRTPYGREFKANTKKTIKIFLQILVKCISHETCSRGDFGSIININLLVKYNSNRQQSIH